MMSQDINLSHIVNEILNGNLIISAINSQRPSSYSKLPKMYSIYFPNGRKDFMGNIMYSRLFVTAESQGYVSDRTQPFNLIRDVKVRKLHDALDEHLMMIKLGVDPYIERYARDKFMDAVIAMDLF